MILITPTKLAVTGSKVKNGLENSILILKEQQPLSNLCVLKQSGLLSPLPLNYKRGLSPS